MSRYELQPRDGAAVIKAVVGWDRPLQTFFAQLFTLTAQEPVEGEATTWVGTEPGELLTAAAAIGIVAAHAHVPADLEDRLQADMDASSGQRDGAHQRSAKALLFGTQH